MTSPYVSLKPDREKMLAEYHPELTSQRTGYEDERQTYQRQLQALRRTRRRIRRRRAWLRIMVWVRRRIRGGARQRAAVGG